VRPICEDSVVRRALVVSVACLVLATGCGNTDPPETEDDLADLWKSDSDEPYPFTTPIPPLEKTAIDGTYLRSIGLEEGGGYPPSCRRCAPYRITAGEASITLEDGRFRIHDEPARRPKPPCPTCHQPPDFTSLGHYLVDGDRVVFFNDGNCPGMRGVYEWSLDDAGLTLDIVEDECPYASLRERYLTYGPWSLE
jgi:hypothetical protein